jgi:hypothetical protein
MSEMEELHDLYHKHSCVWVAALLGPDLTNRNRGNFRHVAYIGVCPCGGKIYASDGFVPGDSQDEIGEYPVDENSPVNPGWMNQTLAALTNPAFRGPVAEALKRRCHDDTRKDNTSDRSVS